MKRRTKILITVLLAGVVIGFPQLVLYLTPSAFDWVNFVLSATLGYIGGTFALIVWLDEIERIGLK